MRIGEDLVSFQFIARKVGLQEEKRVDILSGTENKKELYHH